MKKYHEITILHVLACGMILLCHFFQDAKIGSLGEIFLAGLSVFFIVSGFLTGLKPKYNTGWLRNRFKRILLPYYVVTFSFLILLFFFTNEFNLISTIHLATASQGINYFIWPYDLYGAMPGIGHLWYITIILLCFVFTPILDKLYKRYTPTLTDLYVFLAILICAVQPILIYFGIQISYIISFLIGFLYARQGYVMTAKRYLSITLIFTVITIIRFIGMRFIDGSVFYDRYIALVSQGALAVFIFTTIFFIGRLLPEATSSIGKSKVVVLLASIIYEIYLLHYFFLRGPWPIKNYIGNLFVADLIIVLLSIIVGLILSKSMKRFLGTKLAHPNKS